MQKQLRPIYDKSESGTVTGSARNRYTGARVPVSIPVGTRVFKYPKVRAIFYITFCFRCCQHNYIPYGVDDMAYCLSDYVGLQYAALVRLF